MAASAIIEIWVFCEDEKSVPELLNVPYRDYCWEPCFNELFSLATRDDAFSPLHCCQEVISLESPVPSFRFDNIRDSVYEFIEFSVKDRTHCNDPACVKFIPPAQISVEKAACAMRNPAMSAPRNGSIVSAIYGNELACTSTLSGCWY